MQTVYILWSSTYINNIYGVFKNLETLTKYAIALYEREDSMPNENVLKINKEDIDHAKKITINIEDKISDKDIYNKSDQEDSDQEESNQEESDQEESDQEESDQEDKDIDIKIIHQIESDISNFGIDLNIRFKVILSTNNTILRPSNSDSSHCFLVTPIEIDNDGPVWLLSINICGAGESYLNDTYITHCQNINNVYDNVKGFMESEHNRNDDSDTYDEVSNKCTCHNKNATCWAALCKMCETGKSEQCIRSWFVKLMKSGETVPEHCSHETIMKLIKVKVV